MTPRILFWLACGAGVVIFTALGMLLARLRASSPDRDGNDSSDALRAELRAAQAALDQRVAGQSRELQSKLDATRAELARLQSASAQSAARLEQLQAEHAQLQAQLERSAELERAAASAGDQRQRDEAQHASRLEAELDRLQRDLRESRREAATLAEQLASATLERDREEQQLLQQLEGVTTGRDQLEQRLAAATAESEGLRARLGTLTHERGRQDSGKEQQRRALEAAESARATAESARAMTESARAAAEAALASAESARTVAEVKLRGERERSAQREAELQREHQAREAALRADHEAVLAAWRSDLEKERAATTQAVDELEEARRRAAALRARVEHAEQADAERFELREQAQGFQAQLAELARLQAVAREYDELKLDAVTLRRRAEDKDGLAHRCAELTAKLAQAEADRTELTTEVGQLQRLAEERTDFALRVQVLEARLAELETLRAQQAAFETQEAELAALHARVTALDDENASLRAQGLVRRAPQRPQIVEDADAPVGQSLERALARLLQDGSARCAVLADDLGLVVAGIGDHIEALAAVSAMHGEITRRVSGVLPLGRVSQFILADENGLYFTAQPVATDSGDLLLATLTVGRELDVTLLKMAAS